MPRERRVEAALGLEIELELRGNFQPGYPATGPSYASGGEPGEPDCIEDAEVVGVYLERRARDQYGLPAMESYAHDLGFPAEEPRQRPKYERVDLLEKLTPGAREEVLRVWGEVLRHEAEERLLEDADDES